VKLPEKTFPAAPYFQQELKTKETILIPFKWDSAQLTTADQPMPAILIFLQRHHCAETAPVLAALTARTISVRAKQ
jgi:hypothetical protein